MIHFYKRFHCFRGAYRAHVALGLLLNARATNTRLKRDNVHY